MHGSRSTVRWSHDDLHRLLRRCIRTLEAAFAASAKHSMILADACERWLRYRDNRNTTTHDYGERFAEATLKLLPAFIADANALADVVEEPSDD